MCGILGWVSLDSRPIPVESLGRSLDLLRHRGPDSRGEWSDATAWLGHRRLSILDISPSGNQPMMSDCGRYVMVFNGEFYNYKEHVPYLEKKGYQLKSSGDSAALLGLYSLLGEKCLELVNGMFALAIWDKKERTLFLSRDRMGKKPLYYSVDNNRVLFASELKAITPLLRTRTLDGNSIDAYFAFGYIPAPLSIFQEVRKLEAATFMKISGRGQRSTRYWALTPPEKQDATEEEIEHVLQESIDHRFVSDVPVGVLLSGGIDSSLITAIAAGKMGRKFKTFCMAGGKGSFDERGFADIVARQYGTEHLAGSMDSTSVAEQLDNIMPFIDEPFADSSVLPTFQVAKLARSQVKVVLSGEGGDEVFGGYGKYINWNRVERYRKLPFLLRKSLRLFDAFLDESKISRMQSFIKLNRYSFADPVSVFQVFNTMSSHYVRSKIYSEEFSKSFLDSNAGYFNTVEDKGFDAPVFERILALDRKTYLAEDLMFKADRMSMANSLEVRCPFLDHRVIELSTRIPEKQKILGSNTKIIMRKIAEKYLPPSIYRRPKKGFSIPIHELFKIELKEMFVRVVLDGQCLPEFFNYSAIRELFSNHLSGKAFCGNSLWSLLIFHLWSRDHLIASS